MKQSSCLKRLSACMQCRTPDYFHIIFAKGQMFYRESYEGYFLTLLKMYSYTLKHNNCSSLITCLFNRYIDLYHHYRFDNQQINKSISFGERKSVQRKFFRSLSFFFLLSMKKKFTNYEIEKKLNENNFHSYFYHICGAFNKFFLQLFEIVIDA